MKKPSTNFKKDVVDEIHSNARRNFRRRGVIIKGINDLIVGDLIEVIPYAKLNKNFKYILVVINAFTKFVWVEPLKNKTAREVSTAMLKILSKMKVKPKNLWTDLGREFMNSEFEQLMKQWKINHYNTFSTKKASIVERVIRTLKTKMWKHFSLQGNYKWTDHLQEIVSEYNSTKHSKTGMKPKDVKKKDEKYLLEHVYVNYKIADPKKSKFKKNDYVRISKFREAFSKGYTPNWSNEIFKINEIVNSNPKTYKIIDSENQIIKGTFYEPELLKVKHPDIYLVEKILKKKPNKVYVKWLGLGDKHNSWISKKQLI